MVKLDKITDDTEIRNEEPPSNNKLVHFDLRYNNIRTSSRVEEVRYQCVGTSNSPTSSLLLPHVSHSWSLIITVDSFSKFEEAVHRHPPLKKEEVNALFKRAALVGQNSRKYSYAAYHFLIFVGVLCQGANSCWISRTFF